jgi:hypothetical protein
MSRLLGHPDPAALASLRAEQVGTRRGRRLSAHVARCARCTEVCERFDALSATLASAPVPLLPWVVERRVVTALAVESARRARQAGPGIPRPRSAGWRPEPGIGQGRPHGWPRTRKADRPRGVAPVRRWLPGPRSSSRTFTGPGVLASTVASLLVVCAGVGYLISGQQPTALGRSALIASPYRDGGARTSAFLVSDTGTRYRQSTLRSQVRDRLAEQVTGQPVQPTQPGAGPTAGLSAGPPAPPPNPAPGTPLGTFDGSSADGSTSGGSTADGSNAGGNPGSGSNAGGNPGSGSPGSGSTADGSAADIQSGVAPATEITPSRSLIGCVMHLTGDIPPEFVDRATYQSEPVYVIVVPDEAWVVGIGCTAAQPALITSVRLSAAG